MERPKRFKDGVIPDSIKKQDDGVMIAKKERIAQDNIRLQEAKERYDAEPGDSESGNKVHIRSEILELCLNIAVREEEIRRYEEDPNSDFMIHRIEREEMKKKIMKEMGYSEKMLEYMDQNIESLKKRGVE